MPWRCTVCGKDALDDATRCPGCGATKTTWTVQGDHTRTLVVQGPRLEVKRGERTEPLPAGQAHLEDVVLLDTDEAPALPKARVAALHREGLRPAPAHIVFVLHGQPPDERRKVEVTIEFAGQPLETRPYPFQRGGWFEARLVFVRGPDPEGWADVAFPGLELVDVTELDGYAPSVEVVVQRKRKELAVVPVDDDRPKVLRVEPRATACRHEAVVPVPLPDGWLHPLAALVRAASLLVERPDHRLLLLGHASAPGSDARNDAVADARARALLALIEGDRDGWVQLATEHGSLADVKGYLDYLARRRGWSCDPGDTTAKNDAGAKRGVEGFQREYAARFERPLDADGVCGKATLGALFDVMRHELERWLEKHGLTPAALVRGEPAAVSCGERFVAAPTLPQPATEDARRFVDVLVVPPDVPPDPEAIYGGQWPIELVALEDEPGDWERGRVIVATDVRPEAAATATDRYTLRAADGSYERTMALAADATQEFGGLDLVFEDVPTQARLELLVAVGDEGPRSLFSDLTYAEVARASSHEHLGTIDPFELPEDATGGEA